MFLKIKHFKRDFNKWTVLIVSVGLFLAIPVFSILISLFRGNGEMWEHITTNFLFDYIKNSIILIFGTGLLTFTIGTSSAWIISRYTFRYKKIIEWLLFMPLAIPSYIVAYTYVGLIGNGGTFIEILRDFGFSVIRVEMMNIYGLIWVLSFSLRTLLKLSATIGANMLENIFYTVLTKSTFIRTYKSVVTFVGEGGMTIFTKIAHF